MSRGPTRRRILIGAAAAATVAVVGPVAKAVAAPATGSGDECGERYQAIATPIEICRTPDTWHSERRPHRP